MNHALFFITPTTFTTAMAYYILLLYIIFFSHFTTLLPVVYDSVNGLDSSRPLSAIGWKEHLLLKDVAHNLSHLKNSMGV